jgi:hypothetical protein
MRKIMQKSMRKKSGAKNDTKDGTKSGAKKAFQVMMLVFCLVLTLGLMPLSSPLFPTNSAFADVDGPTDGPAGGPADDTAGSPAGGMADGPADTSDFQPERLEYPELIFNPQTAYQGDVTIPANTSPEFTETLVYEKYLVSSYVANPVLGQTFMMGTNSGDHYKMYIYVPVSYGAETFSSVPENERPIMLKVNWGGDMAFPPSGTVSPMQDPAPMMALTKGWVVVDPGILGVNCTGVGPNGEPNYNYGKAPYSIAGLKAAVRYLRYSGNAVTIPGNKERIYATGFSSGGCGTVMLAASGNSALYNDALAELGAAPGRDDIYGTLGSAPIIPRDYSDQAIAFLRFWWLDFSTVDTSALNADQLLGLRVNEALVQSFRDYVPTLGLQADYAVGSVSVGDAITTDNILEYYYPYLKDSCLKYLNGLGGRTQIDAYLATSRGPAPGRVAMPVSELVRPVYGADGSTVVDLDGTVNDIWKTWIDYVYRVPGFGGNIDGTDPTVVDYGFDKPYISPNIENNGVLSQANSAGFTTVGSRTFGKATDWAAAYSPFGLDWIEANTNKTISQEYRDLYEMQCLSLDPMYFIRNASSLGVTVAPHWFIRSGAADSIALPATFLSLTTTLKNRGFDVNAALTWDQGHAPTNEWKEFFDWADTIPHVPPAIPANQGLVIRSALGNELVVDINKNSAAFGTAAIIWPEHGGANQRFVFLPADDGYYYIQNVRSGLLLDIENVASVTGALRAGAAVIQSEHRVRNDASQMWAIVANGSGYTISPKLDSSMRLDVAGAAGMGAKLLIWPAHGGTNQNFRLDIVTGAVADGVYTIKTAGNPSKVLDVSGASAEDGAKVVLFTSHNGDNQRLNLIFNPETGYYNIITAYGKALDITGASSDAGTAIIQWAPHGGANQMWTVASDGNGGYVIKSALNSMVLDVFEARFTDGNRIITWPAHGNANQSWILE